jgi:hypothetical protein
MDDLKKFKNIIVYCVVFVMIISCTVLFIEATAADSEPQIISALVSPKQVDLSDSQYLAWGVTNGALSIEKEEINQEELEVKSLLEAFGKTLQKVSLLAPKYMVAASIEENYEDYVTPELLQKWLANPQSAPGRMVSSPWPDRIDIVIMEKTDVNQYTVHGEVIEVTSVELLNGGAAARCPVTIVVQKVNDCWLISDMKIGEYIQRIVNACRYITLKL